MAEKISMLIVKVDLDCHKCYDKMRKILCKLQDQERIRTISFDDKSKTIAIAGPFDPQRLACKIRCRGGKTVKDIQIVDVGGGGGGGNGKPPPPPGNNNGKKKQKEKPAPAAEQPPPPPQPSSPPPEPASEPPPERPPSPPPQPATPDRGMASTMPAFHEEDRPMPPPAQVEPPSPHEKPPPVEYYMPPPQEKPPPMEYYMPPPPAALPPPPAMKPRPPTPPPCPNPKPAPPSGHHPVDCVIPTVEIPSWPAAPVGPCGCPCCAPCYQGYYDGCRCGCGGARMYGCSTVGLGPPPAWCAPRGCRIINEEDPNAACSIM